MYLFASVTVLLSSETARTATENLFAKASTWFADNLVVAITTVAVLAIACLILSRPPKGAPPVLSPKVPVPVVGSFLEFAKDPLGIVRRGQKALGNVFTIKMAPGVNMTFLLGPEAQAPFFKSHDNVLSQAEVYGFMTSVFGKDVVYDAPPKLRIQQMQTMANGLKSTALKRYVPKIIAETRAFFADRSRFGDEGEIDLGHALAELTILTASRCLHGDEVREELFEEVAALYHDLDRGIDPLAFFWANAPTPAHRKRDKARVEVSALFGKVINARREKGDDGVERTDILQRFMDAQFKDGSRLTNDQIAGLLIALLFAGQHTSSVTSTWTSMFLTQDPELLAQVRAEQDEVLEGGAREMSFEAIQQMELLHNCIKETLRLHPPLIFLMRKAKQPLQVGEYTVPVGHTVVASPAVSMRMEDVFTNPGSYDPHRFDADRAEDATKFSYVAFGGGLHGCLGQAFAFVQLKCILTELVKTFDFELTGPFPEPDYEAMVVGPKPGMAKVRYRRRA